MSAMEIEGGNSPPPLGDGIKLVRLTLNNGEGENVNAAAEEEVNRPWRVYKAQVQKPKNLHKTGRENKEDASRLCPPAPAPPKNLTPIPKYAFCSHARMTRAPPPLPPPPQPREKSAAPPRAAPNKSVSASQAAAAMLSISSNRSSNRKNKATEPEGRGDRTVSFLVPKADGRFGFSESLPDPEIRKTFKVWLWRRSGFKHYDVLRELKIESVIERHRYRYKLESFMERRSAQWIKFPYHGDGTDGPESPAPAPVLGPWEFERGPTNGTLWENEAVVIPVAGTEMVRPCTACDGKGWAFCWKCDQAGKYLCYWCDGKGGFYDGEGHWKYCWTCRGIGVVYCTVCKGFSKIVCSYCEGFFEVKFFILLKIEFFSKVSKYYYEEVKTDVPLQKEKKWTGCRSGSGKRIFEQENTTVAPLSNFDVPDLNLASKSFMHKHENPQQGLRIHHQRHSVDVIPIYQITASWKDNRFQFWIYGQENHRKIFFPDADEVLPPRKACCRL